MVTLVTGGTGFVGSNIVKALAKRGHQVVCFDLVSPSDLVHDYLKSIKDQVTFVVGDILKESDLLQLTDRNITKIVHAAVFTGVLPEVELSRSRDIVNINVNGTTNLLEFASHESIERFLYVSSGSVYGDDHDLEKPLSETAILRPRTLYASTKYASELITRRYGEIKDFQTVSVRLGSPYGPMERVTGHRSNQSLLKDWTGRLLRKEQIEVSDRNLRRSFSYVTDIADGICVILDAPHLTSDVYNNGSSDRIPLKKIIELLQLNCPTLEVKDVPSVDLTGSAYTLDSSRIKDELGFTPSVDLASGLERYIEWRRSNDFTE